MDDTGWFKDVDLFKHLSAEAQRELASQLQARDLEEGEVLFHLGDPGDELFIVRTGRLALVAPSEGEGGAESTIRILGPGDVLGEMALIDGAPRSLGARALEATRVQVLAGDDFRDLLRRSPDAAFAVMAGLNGRIRYTTTFLTEVRTWVQRVAEGDYDRHVKPDEAYADPSIAALAAEFAQMAARVKEREAALRQEVARLQLRVEVDETKKQRQVAEITGSDYFQQLKNQAQAMRRRREEES